MSEGQRAAAQHGVGHRPRPSVNFFLGFIALAGLAAIALSALRLADITVLVSVPTTMFLGVYLSCTLSAARLLTGKTRPVAAVAVLASPRSSPAESS